MGFDLCNRIVENISRVIVGKRPVIELLLAGLLAEGHVLLEIMPGPGKTLRRLRSPHQWPARIKSIWTGE